MKRLNLKQYIKVLLLSCVVASVLYTAIAIAPYVYKSTHIKMMTDDEVLEYVIDLDDDELITLCNSVTKVQAKRILSLKTAYDIILMEQEDKFPYINY